MVKCSETSLDATFAALADPTRRALLTRLGTDGGLSVGELARPLPMSLPAVHQHLQVLQDCGLVRSEKTGRVRTCHLQPAVLDSAEEWMRARRAGWQRRLDRLGTHLDESPDQSRELD